MTKKREVEESNELYCAYISKELDVTLTGKHDTRSGQNCIPLEVGPPRELHRVVSEGYEEYHNHECCGMHPLPPNSILAVSQAFILIN